jgi:phage baseplate assembly protein W
MAFDIRQIDPLDLQPRKAIGVKLPFSGTTVFNSTFTSNEAVKTNLINYFLTARGERYLNVDFGNGLQALLFDQLTEDKVREIDARIKSDLELYFPRVEIVKIETEGIPDTNSVEFLMRYKIKNTNIEDEVIINFEQ